MALKRDARAVLADVEADLGLSADPLEYLLRVMANPDESPAARAAAARDALPYIHAKRAAEGEAEGNARPELALAQIWARLHADPTLVGILQRIGIAAHAPDLLEGESEPID